MRLRQRTESAHADCCLADRLCLQRLSPLHCHGNWESCESLVSLKVSGCRSQKWCKAEPGCSHDVLNHNCCHCGLRRTLLVCSCLTFMQGMVFSKSNITTLLIGMQLFQHCTANDMQGSAEGITLLVLRGSRKMRAGGSLWTRQGLARECSLFCFCC